MTPVVLVRPFGFETEPFRGVDDLVGWMPANFSRSVTSVGGVQVAALCGELDLETAEGLADWLIEHAGPLMVVDLKELTFMDSSGIGALEVARQQLAEDDQVLVVTRPTRIVRRALEIIGLTSWIETWDPAWEWSAE
jgi:stage II sporulation protein AA (anti-sigma F factor antagonist)